MNDTPTVPAEHFMATIAANVNNFKLSDEAFREFIRNTLPIVIFSRPNCVYRPEIAATAKFAMFKGIKNEGEVYGGVHYHRFISSNQPNEDQTRLATGEVAYQIIGYAETVQEAQQNLHRYG